ncbi:tail fiber assembly protein [Citrobacter freundii]|uniref:tail fiber assembly protein n=1 Tax=Enterobacteriaceae TaxID=543 RepID=UPI001330F94B|nr:tail fiber assembly protein [Escherichia coli]
MDRFFYSPSRNEFYIADLMNEYIKSMSWPDDAIEISSEIVDEFIKTPAAPGKMRVAGDDGLPAWSATPSPTQAELVAAASSEKTTLRTIADSEIAWRKDAVDAGIATEEETAALAEWVKYRVLLMRVDTAAPEWPVPPEA